MVFSLWWREFEGLGRILDIVKNLKSSRDVRTAVSGSMSLLISFENTISTAIYEHYLINITYLS